MRNARFLAVCSFVLFSLAACGSIKTEAKYPTGENRGTSGGDIYTEGPTIWGNDGLNLFNNTGDKDEKGGAGGIGVNSYLWRASLDTISFIPLASADPFGGVIITDWYSPPESPNERFKLNVLILSRELRADALQVKVFGQSLNNGTWRDTITSKDTALKLEDTILTRARQMRVAKRDR